MKSSDHDRCVGFLGQLRTKAPSQLPSMDQKVQRVGVPMAAGGRRSMPGGQRRWLSFFGDPTVFFFRKILGLIKNGYHK